VCVVRATYIGSCAACHRTDGNSYAHFFPALAGNTAVVAEDPTSLISIVLDGDTLPGLAHGSLVHHHAALRLASERPGG